MPKSLGRRAAGVGLLLFALALVLAPQTSTEAAKSGLLLCYNVIIPSLFPFFVLSSLVVSLGFTGFLGRLLQPVMRPLFRLNGACASALALGFVGGYPVGAKTALHLYTSGQCSREEAQRLLAFCNNCGPAFILGVVGTGVFRSGSVGLLLCLTHMLSAFLVGILFRRRGERSPAAGAAPLAPPPAQSAGFAAAFTGAVKDSFMSVLAICAFVVFFTVLSQLLILSGLLPALAALLALPLSPLGVTAPWLSRLLIGMLEVSTGVTALTDGPLALRLASAAFLLGWGGLSVHCQALSFLSGSGLSVRPYFAGKLLQGLFSGGMVLLLFRFLPKETASVFAPSVSAAALPSLTGVLVLSLLACFALLLFFLLPALFSGKKQWKKPRGRCIMGKTRRR